jgi:hypothetical protein
MQYPYSKIEGGIILALMLLIWGLGAYYLQMRPIAYVLSGIGAPLLLLMLFLRYVRK